MARVGTSLFRGLNGASGLKRRLKRDVDAGFVPADRAQEKLGRSETSRPDGPLLWVHLDAKPDLEKAIGVFRHVRAEYEELNLLVTLDGEAKLPELSDHAFIQIAPYDTRETSAAFLHHWRPDVVLWMSEDMTHPVLHLMNTKHVPCIWVDAVAPKPSVLQRKLLAGSMRETLNGFVSIVAQNDLEVVEFHRLGVAKEKLEHSGILQAQVLPPTCDMAERDVLAKHLGARPVWLAMRATRAELAVVRGAHRRALRKSHRLLLILVPDDTGSAAKLSAELEADGWTVALRSRDLHPNAEDQIFVVDSPEEYGLWMQLAPICFAGGTLSSGARLNPLEPAALGSVVLFGGATQPYASAFNRLKRAQAALYVRDTQGLADGLEHLLSPENAANMAMAAWDETTRGAETSDYVRDLLLQALDETDQEQFK